MIIIVLLFLILLCLLPKAVWKGFGWLVLFFMGAWLLKEIQTSTAIPTDIHLGNPGYQYPSTGEPPKFDSRYLTPSGCYWNDKSELSCKK